MHRRKQIWAGKNGRRTQFVETGNPDRPFFFGYEEVTPQEKAEKVRRHFDSVARCYDLMNTLLSFGIHYLWKKTAVRSLDLRPGKKVLDVCGGTGDLSVLAARQVGPSGAVVLFDINRNMIAAGKHRFHQRPSICRIDPIQGDAEHIPFPTGAFDAAMVGFGIRNVTHMENGLAEMYRVLKPGGKMMCLEFSKPVNPAFRWLYDIYSIHIMPLIGQAVVGLGQAYAHLPESIRMFAVPEEMATILHNVGFTHVRYRRFTNGIATVHLAIKR